MKKCDFCGLEDRLHEDLCIKCWCDRAKDNGKTTRSYMLVLLLTVVAIGFFTVMNTVNASACWDMAKASDRVQHDLFDIRLAIGADVMEGWKNIPHRDINSSNEDLNVCGYKALLPDVAERAKAKGDNRPAWAAAEDMELIFAAHAVKRKWLEWSLRFPKPKEDLDK